MAVGNVVPQVPRSGHRLLAGEFAVAGGAIVAGSVKTKGDVAVTKPGATGQYLLQFLLNGVAGRPGSPCRISGLAFVFNNLAATEGGWSWFVVTDAMNASGSVLVQFNQQSFAAADPASSHPVKFELWIDKEVA